jgi:hypothetical protein
MESEPTVPSLPSTHMVPDQNLGFEPPPHIRSEVIFPKTLTPVERASHVRSSDPPRKRYETLDFDITFNDVYEECNHRNINLR